MYGFEAVAAHNGWSIAILGILIVFTGLTLLSVSIAYFTKILNFYNEKNKYLKKDRKWWQVFKYMLIKKQHKTNDIDNSLTLEPKSFDKLKEPADQYYAILQYLGEPFQLPELLDIAKKRGLEKPHSTINDLLLAKLIIPHRLGYFCWNHKKYKQKKKIQIKD